METDVRQFLQPIFKNEFLIEQKLCEKAIKILLKFIESGGPAAAPILESSMKQVEYKFLTLAQVRHNFKAITSQETLLICGELERIGLLEGQLFLGRLRYRFNIDPSKAGKELFSPPTEVILAAQKRYLEHINKKLLSAAKTIKRYKPMSYGVTVLSEPKTNIENLEKKTALELHQSKECDPNICRFCLVEKGA